MRRTLVGAVALAPLCLALGWTAARAEDDVTTGLTSPIATATATSGAPDDISIQSNGSVTVTGTTPAVTQNSPNFVLNAGAISTKDVNGSTGVLITQGTTFTNTGSITLSESYSPKDSLNSDGIVEAPFASPGSYGRTGVGATGTGLSGAFSNSGTISVQGNVSYGVNLAAPVGSLTDTGTITLIGDDTSVVNGATINGGAVALQAGQVNGDVLLEGGITATGLGARAVNLTGPVAGSVSVYSSITATGYSTTTRPTTQGELTNLQKTPTDLEQSGAAMTVGGSVANGIFIGAPPVNTLSTSTADLDGDGIPDSAEGTGAVNIYGSAPALLIGGPTAITIGPFSNNGIADTEAVPQTPPANDYDLIVRGSLNAQGTFDLVPATALQIGGAGGTVTMSEGVRVVGSINATSYDADATAVHIAAGSTVGAIRNEGFIDATVSKSVLDATLSPALPLGNLQTAATAYGVLIDAGANVSSLTNYGFLSASITGNNGSAAVVTDKGGGLSTVVNEGDINASITPSSVGASVSGTEVALDLSANTSGVNLLQQANPNPIEIDVQTTTSASGTTTTTASTTGTVSGSTATSGGATTASTTTTTTVTTTASGVTTTTTTTTPTVPEIIGAVKLGSGTNTVQLLAGSVTGALDLGSGTTGENASLTIDNTSGVSGAITTFVGPLTYEGTGLALSVDHGVLENTSATALNLRSLNVGSNGVLYAAIDPAHGTSTLYNVAGPATLASGAQLGVVLNTPLTGTASYTVIQATSLSNANADTSLVAYVPYLVNAQATTDAAAGTIDVTLSEKSAAQLGLNAGQTAALAPILASLGNDTGIQAELLGQYSRSGFLGVYNQLLPDYAGGVFQMASAASDAITRATARSNDIENPSGTRGAWAQEFAFDVNRPDSGATAYQGQGFGFVGGLETGGAGLGAFGVTGAFAAGNIDDPHAPGDNLQSISEGELGGYWQGQLGGLRADARVGGGYVYFADRRQLYEADSTGTIELERNAKGSGRGWTATGHFGAAYQFDFGRWFVRPNAQADYFELYEGSFTEHGGASTTGGDGFDLALASRTGRQASGLAAVTVGASLGRGFIWRPELQVGYRDVLSGTAGDTTAAFQGGQNFTLLPVAITGGGPLARLGVKADTDFYELDFQAGAEERNKFTEADIRLNVRVLF